MFKLMRTGLAALAVSALVVVPVATTVTIITTDAAYANNGNGNGGGNGGGRGGGNSGGKGGSKGGNGGDSDSRSADKVGKAKGKGYGNGQQNRTASKGKSNKGGKGFGRAVKDDFNRVKKNVQRDGIAGLFKSNRKGGKHQRTTSQAFSAKPTKNAPVASTRPARKVGYKIDNPMHPSKLGKMNGLLNSSYKAKEAHIANGQWAKGTGPVSIGAALAVADYQKAAVDTLAAEDSYTEAQTSFEEASMTAKDLGIENVVQAQNVLTTAAEEEAAGVEDPTYSPEKVEAAQGLVDADAELTEATDERPEASEVVKAQEAVEDMVAANDDPSLTTPEEIAHANVEDAEAAVLSIYKSDPTGYEDHILDEARDAVENVDVHGALTRGEDRETIDPYSETGYDEDDFDDDDYSAEDLEADATEAAIIDVETLPDQG